MDVDGLDIKLFIESIKLYPELWNSSDPDFLNKDKRHLAWMAVGSVVYKGFASLTEHGKNDLGILLGKKWRNIKDNYVKNLKKIQFDSTIKKYCYAPYLSFLKIERPSNKQNHKEKSGKNNKRQHFKEEQIKEELLQEKDVAGSRKKTRKLRRQEISLSGPSFNKAQKMKSNSDLAFFESILPFVEKFNELQKLEFRSEVMNLIKRVKHS